MPVDRKKPKQLNLRITQTARILLGRIADKHGSNLTQAQEFAIRQTARMEGVWLDEHAGTSQTLSDR